MNSINRLEETWTPEWNLGLQDEFGFSFADNAVKEPQLATERPNAWSIASRELLNRQTPTERRTTSEASRLEEVIKFLEALSVEIAIDE